MNTLLIKGATVVNEGAQYIADVLVEHDLIVEVNEHINAHASLVLDGTGKYLLPGVIDTHVHFREPGLTAKGDISTESAAAVAGGVTSYFDMPNSIPNTVTPDELRKKYALAEYRSFANYAFYLGATLQTTDFLPMIANNNICGLTDDGLYFTNEKSLLVDQPELLRKLLRATTKIISIHSEDEALIDSNLSNAELLFGDDIPFHLHPFIRSEEACFNATRRAVSIASECGGRLHLLHLSTERETQLLQSGHDVTRKRLTAEVCVHHLWFTDKDYQTLGSRIKWNPSIKTSRDRTALMAAVNDDRIDIISTDHAPHLLSEKNKYYKNAPSGAPMVQHSLLVMLELVARGETGITKVVEKMCHNPAKLFAISKRGFIRPGYYADLVLVDPVRPTIVDRKNLLYKCGWSPLEGLKLSASIDTTIVNGMLSFRDGCIQSAPAGQSIGFGSVAIE